MPRSAERERTCNFDDPCSLTSAELLDADARASALIADMPSPREQHGAVAVEGGVLVFGGIVSGGACVRPLRAGARWDQTSGRWHDAPGLLGGLGPSVTALRRGEVLVAGGFVDVVPGSSAQRWDRAAATWRATASLQSGRYLHAAVALPDGRVLVAGGLTGNPDGSTVPLVSAEVYDPDSDRWTETGNLVTARIEASLTVLPGGGVLAIGGYGFGDTLFDSAEIWDPSSGTWSQSDALHHPRVGHTATSLGDGRVLVVGGAGGGHVDGSWLHPPLSEAEIFDPTARRFTVTDGPTTPRSGHTATLLGDGRLIVIGGRGGAQMVDSAEIWAG